MLKMGWRRIGWVSAVGLSRAAPLHTRQTTTSNSHSAKIIAPVVIVAVVCAMLVAFGWWKRRKRTQELINQLQTPAATTNTSTNNANPTTQTTPSTGADAPARPPRRRRRRRPSQISTKSLPAYNEQAGDEEIVLVRRAQQQEDESDDEDSNEHEPNDRSAQASTSHAHAPDSRPLLDDDSSPDMPRVSLASSTHGRSLNDHPDQSQSRAESQLGHAESIANTTMASSIADTEAEPPALHPPAEVPSYLEAMSTSHVNLPSTTEHSAEPSGSTATDSGPARPADADGTVRPKRKSVFRHLGRFNITKPSGSSTPANEAVEMTASRTSTSTHRPSISISGHRPSGSTSTHRPSTSLSTTNAHKPSPSLSSLSLILTRSQSPTMSRTSLNISAPISTTLVRTELNYPRAGPTPEQIRFLSSRESLGRFGMPYGEEAIAAAKSREQLPLPPLYKPRTDASGSGTSPGAGGNSPGASGSSPGASGGANENGTRTGTEPTEDEPTITLRRGPMLLTPGELAQRKNTETAASARAGDHRPDPDPAMTISEEPIATRDAFNNEEDDTKSVQEEPVGSTIIQDGQISQEPMSVQEEPRRIQSRASDGDVESQDGNPARRRESPHEDLNDGRRESVMTTHSFVTATEGQGDSDSSPPTPTAETYQAQSRSQVSFESHAPHHVPGGGGAESQVLNGAEFQDANGTEPHIPNGQSKIPNGAQTPDPAPARSHTVLIPESRDALHPELTLVPATPIG